MKVILLQDVKSVGKKGDMVELSEGYARNFILPKKLGVEANSANMNNLKLQKANEEKVAKEIYEAAQAFAKDLETKEIILTLKTGEGGRTFGSVSSKEISEAAKKQLNLDLQVTGAVKTDLAEKAYDEKYGARPLKRAIQSRIEDALTEEILEGKVKPGDSVCVKLSKGEIQFVVKE
mgnify:CR=1 FL=1